MKRAVALFCFAVFFFQASCVLAAPVFTVSDKAAREGDIIYFSKDDLPSGKLAFSIPIPQDADSAEISLDNGRRWEKMERKTDNFVYDHRVFDDARMYISFLFKSSDGKTRIQSTGVLVVYQARTPYKAIVFLLDQMKSAYESENKGRFLSYISYRFPNRTQFEQAIQNDFYYYNNITLFYRIDRSDIDANFEGAIWNVRWEKKWMDRYGNTFSKTAGIAMRFDKDQNAWVCSGMDNNTIFGSSLLSYAQLSIKSSDITDASVAGDHIVRALIYNTGNVDANNFTVAFTVVGNPERSGTVSVTTIKANSSLAVDYKVPTPGFAGKLVRVLVDSGVVIAEDTRSDNEAEKQF